MNEANTTFRKSPQTIQTTFQASNSHLTLLSLFTPVGMKQDAWKEDAA